MWPYHHKSYTVNAPLSHTHQRQHCPHVLLSTDDEQRRRVHVCLLCSEHIHPPHPAACLKRPHPQLISEGHVAGWCNEWMARGPTDDRKQNKKRTTVSWVFVMLALLFRLLRSHNPHGGRYHTMILVQLHPKRNKLSILYYITWNSDVHENLQNNKRTDLP